MSNTPTLCLTMIVKNESAVIRRALASAVPHIDSWCICDTGSTDGTPELIQEILKDIPGTLHRTEWRNFGHNRTEALRLARQQADYCLMLDADFTVNVRGEFKSKLKADAYHVRVEGDLDYANTFLTSTKHEWSFVGVTHEYKVSPTATQFEAIPELTLTDHCDGGMRYEKFERDIRLLTQSITEDPNNARDTFYLAQSYKDIGNHEKALECYIKRIGMGGWAEEVFYAYYQAARMKELLGQPWSQVCFAYLAAYNFRPTRLEPIYHIVRHYREQQQWALGYFFGVAVMHQDIAYPKDLLFIERPVYEYLLPFEFATCALGTGRKKFAWDAFTKLSRDSKLPAWIFPALEHNLRLAA